MPQAAAHKWQFRARFRRGALGWKSQPAIQRANEAISLARCTPCAPQTLTRAARDFAEERPSFAMEAGMTALHWLVEGCGYEITALDVVSAYSSTLQAAENARCADVAQQRIRELVTRESAGERFVNRVLGPRLGLS